MELRTFIVKKDKELFKIEEDYPEVGAYLYVIKDDICIYDSLQNDYKACMELAYELYGILENEWIILRS